MAREKGVVKWFSDRKGYGFIERKEGDDVFVHYNEIAGEGYRSLAEGEEVEFDVVQDPKGLRAEDVHRLGGGDRSDNVVTARGRVRTLSESRRQFSEERQRLARRLHGGDESEEEDEGTAEEEEREDEGLL